MNIRSGLFRPCADPCTIVLDIIDGKRWVASSIVNLHVRQHCRMLGRLFKGDHPSFPPLRRALRRLLWIVTSHSKLLEAVHPAELSVISILVRLAAYEDKWIRQPEDWRPDLSMPVKDHWRSLVDHLLAPAKGMPRFLANAWLVRGSLHHIERDWYCELAQGRSLREVADTFCLPVRALQRAWRAPEDLSIRQALRWGQVQALGGSVFLAKAVLESRMTNDFANHRIWRRLIEKFAAAGSRQARFFGLVSDFIRPLLADDQIDRIEQLIRLPFLQLRRHAQSEWQRLLDDGRRSGVYRCHSGIANPGVREHLRFLHARRWRVVPGTSKEANFTLGRWTWNVKQLTSRRELLEGQKCTRRWWWSPWMREGELKCVQGDLALFLFRGAMAGSEEEEFFLAKVDTETRSLQDLDYHWFARSLVQYRPVARAWAFRSGFSDRMWR